MINKEWAQALVCLTFASSMDPHSGRKLMRKGIARRFCNETENAVADLRRALELLSGDLPQGVETEDTATTKKQLGIALNQLGMDNFDAEDYTPA